MNWRLEGGRVNRAFSFTSSTITAATTAAAAAATAPPGPTYPAPLHTLHGIKKPHHKIKWSVIWMAWNSYERRQKGADEMGETRGRGKGFMSAS